MTPLQHKMEQISKSYVSTVAAIVGVTNQPSDQDYGIDGTFRLNGIGNQRYRATGFSIDYQLKSSKSPLISKDGIIKYNLEAKNYNDFAYENSATPRILILYAFPDNEHDWVYINKDFTVMQKCAWWTSGLNWQPSSNKSKVTIEIPSKNIFDVEALKMLCELCRKGEPI